MRLFLPYQRLNYSFSFIFLTILFIFLAVQPAFAQDKVYLSDIDAASYKVTLTADQLQQFGCLTKAQKRDIRGAYIEDMDPVNFSLVKNASDPSWSTPQESTVCPNAKKQEIIDADKENAGPSWYEVPIIIVVNRLLWVFANLGVWLIQLTSQLLGQLLAVTRFITHPFVAIGWPFLQGIANLGFILALLFIAAATTLRLEGYGARRMLPKLLLAALLINFSLVIGGVIIDASRILMAIMVNIMGTTKLEDVGAAILKSSQAESSVLQITTGVGIWRASLANVPSKWDSVLQVLQATVLIYGLLVGIVVISVGLFVRYIMLILLLVVSPLAYLAVALPNMGSYAAKWWASFLKYVFYGPIALFVLIMLTQLGKIPGGFLGANNGNSFLDSVFTVGITAAMCIAAATAGSKFGIIGANATVNFVKKAPQAAWRNPKTTAALAGLATGGLGTAAVAGLGALAAQRAGRGVANQARDLGKTVQDNVASRFRKTAIGKYVMPGKRDKEGNLKPGEDSFGARMGRTLTPYKTKEAKAAANAGFNLADTALNPDKLNQKAVREVLTKEQIDLITTTGSRAGAAPREQLMTKILVTDVNIVRSMKDDTKADLLAGPFAAELLRSLREIDRRDSGK